MQTPITITIKSARFFETTLGVVSNALLLLLLLAMDCRGRVRGEAGADIGMGSSNPDWMLFAMLYFFTSTNHEMKQEQQKRKLGYLPSFLNFYNSSITTAVPLQVTIIIPSIYS